MKIMTVAIANDGLKMKDGKITGNEKTGETCFFYGIQMVFLL